MAIVKRISDEERRTARRFQVAWDAVVKGTDPAGKSFAAAGMVQNLSSAGALLCLPKRVRIGARLELRIKVPFKKNNWMKYAAQVVRAKKDGDRIGIAIAVKFDSARPVFLEA